jgi:hypothetical protein
MFQQQNLVWVQPQKKRLASMWLLKGAGMLLLKTWSQQTTIENACWHAGLCLLNGACILHLKSWPQKKLHSLRRNHLRSDSVLWLYVQQCFNNKGLVGYSHKIKGPLVLLLLLWPAPPTAIYHGKKHSLWCYLTNCQFG